MLVTVSIIQNALEKEWEVYMGKARGIRLWHAKLVPRVQPSQ